MHIDFSLPWQEPVLVFALILLIILFVPIFLEKIKIPSILGFIIAGIVIGEYGFNIITRNESIELFGTVGILYLMFVAGLEIDLNEFIKNKSKGIVFGILTIIIPVVVSVPVFYYLLDYSLEVSVLISAIFISHTLVTYPLVSKFGITKNIAVNISIAGTLIADVTALLILAVITNNINSTFEISYWVRFVISIIIFGVIIFWIIPKISRRFFKSVSDNILQYIFVLFIVFVSALLAMLAGLEPIVGAFFAGLTLNRLIPNTSPLMNRIDFIGNAIFIPFFLIGVGMLINYSVLFNSFNALIITIVISVIAVVSKYLAAISTRKIFKLSKQQGLLIFGLSNSRVATALAIALIGFDLIIGQTSQGSPIHFLDENIFNGVVIMILITSTISSFVTQNAGRKIAEYDLKNSVHKDSFPTENSLIGYANEATVENMTSFAFNTINKKANYRIYGLHIITIDKENPETVQRAKKLVNKAEKYAASADFRLKTIIRYDINIASGIINTVKEKNIRHFFIGLHEKSSLIDSFFGNLTNDLLEKNPSTIYIYKTYQPINTIKNFALLIPDDAELEIGFVEWYQKILNLAQNAIGKLEIFATKTTINYIRKNKLIIENMSFTEFNDFDDFTKLKESIKPETLLVVNLARNGSISYSYKMNEIRTLLSTEFKKTGFLLVYPHIFESSQNQLNYSNMSLQDNIENIKTLISKVVKRKSIEHHDPKN